MKKKQDNIAAFFKYDSKKASNNQVEDDTVLDIDVEIAPVFRDFLKPARYKVAYGGRGSGKSWFFARNSVLEALKSKKKILCVRMYQVSMRESVHALISEEIQRLDLLKYFTITDTYIECKLTGSYFLFKGIAKNYEEIKSTEGVDICWVEEAQNVSKKAWEVLIPTIRKDGSEIWISFNPSLEDDATYQDFVVSQKPNSIVKKVNYYDNPHFPQTLRDEMEHCKATDFDAYMNIWEGNCINYSAEQVYNGKYKVLEFDSDIADNNFYHGVDFGFAVDPTATLRCFVLENAKKRNDLYIDHEASGVGVDTDEIYILFNEIPTLQESKKWPIKADSARPETISFLKKQGYSGIRGCKKYAGSVEDGVAAIRSFENIYVHPRCKKVLSEFGNYKFKVDKITGKVLPIIIDANNHFMDALRYALEDYIMNIKKLKWKKSSKSIYNAFTQRRRRYR